ncbi:MAG: DNA translocase FtsK 4TM domain-containing protein [Patescibacteria group bacterium]
MAKKQKKEKEIDNSKKHKKNLPSLNLKDETLNAVWVIIFIVLSIILSLSAIDKAGIAGEKIFKLFSYLLGIGYYVLPILFVILAIARIKSFRADFAFARWVGSGIFLLSCLGLIDILFFDKAGIVGGLVSSPLVKLIDVYATTTLLVALIAISLIIIFDTKPELNDFLFWRKWGRKEYDENEDQYDEGEISVEINNDEESEEERKTKHFSFTKPKEETQEMPKDPSGISPIVNAISGKEFTPPPLSLLERDKGKPGVGDIKANSNIIKRTLQNFGIDVEMDEVSIGPSITRYALKPAEGVKLSRILGLQNNLELALAAHPVRIEAPIPGKSLVGIEIPNSIKSTVGLASILSSADYQDSSKPLLVALGKGISGKVTVADLAKMPHALIAGATGSGKSVTIHAIINSMLFRNSPENLRFIMIDPKRVELTLYNNIPHLLTPVITGAKQAILSLKWAAKEMDRRYDILETEKVRDIQSYHANIVAPALAKLKKKDLAEQALPESMPYIVIVIDELADIMQSYPRELEAAIVRIAQMSRAVGIHLILSTQRPSVNIITGLIKANIPTRIALQVASQIDSRTILDGSGAEKLLGAGDMLYLSGEMSKPVRLQSPFVSEEEVKRVVKYLKDNYDSLPDEINLSEQKDRGSIFEASFDDDSSLDDDDLYEEAKETIIKAGKASTSYLQRKLKVGYARAARLMDMLEERGIIGSQDGSKPRDVIVKNENIGFEDDGFGKTNEEDEEIY